MLLAIDRIMSGGLGGREIMTWEHEFAFVES
jgi:hypothetical protein